MAVVLQVHFPFDGPFDEAMVEAMQSLAHTINDEPGFYWKLWTQDAEAKLAGGVYLFNTREQAAAYLDKHSRRLSEMGIEDIQSRIFEVNEDLSVINHAPL
ncbi:monooxygenase [Halomonas sp. M20]|uniref:monooxygenase n=1 Tax=Halomonas sp. M20 TaxID=2763264 RepID=UPI001D0AF9F1|nr:monooxygenase [Halomonas sp. M20]